MNQFRQILHLSLEEPHDKTLYSLKNKQLIIQEPKKQTLKFDSICFTLEDIVSKLSYEAVLKAAKKQVPTITITFNYNIVPESMSEIIRSIRNIKMFQSNQCQLAHFEVRKGHISDYHKSGQKEQSYIEKDEVEDELDIFEREIQGSIRLERLEKINDLLCFKNVDEEDFDKELISTLKRYRKRTNSFLLFNIKEKIRIVFLILPRNTSYQLSRQQAKQLQQLLILRKNLQQSSKNQKFYLKTPLSQILNKQMVNSNLNILVSKYPHENKQINENFSLNLNIQKQKQQVKQILSNHTKNKLSQLNQQLEKIEKKNIQLKSNIKCEEDHMQVVAKLYTNIVNKVQQSVYYLRNLNIVNISQKLQFVRADINSKNNQIRELEKIISQIQKNIINKHENHGFYIKKIQILKEDLLLSKVNEQNIIEIPENSMLKDTTQLTDDELTYAYNPSKYLSKFRSVIEEQNIQKLERTHERTNFFKTLEEARQQLSKSELSEFQQRYYDIILE